jgi:hypothetical protein
VIARQDAQKQTKAAEDARVQADGLIDFMLYDLHDKLQPIGRLDVLDDVAKKAKGYLDRLPKKLVTASRVEQQAALLGNLAICGCPRQALGSARCLPARVGVRLEE